MKIILLDEDAIRLEQSADRLTIEAPKENSPYTPFQMLASALATCTFSVLQSWSTHANLSSHDIAIEIRWSFVEDPHRVGNMDIKIFWPSLSPERLDAAERVAAKCAIHNTLTHPTNSIISVTQRG